MDFIVHVQNEYTPYFLVHLRIKIKIMYSNFGPRWHTILQLLEYTCI